MFPDFAAAIVPTEFQPGKTFGTGKMKPIDYLLALAEGRIAPPANLDIGTVQHQANANAFRFHINAVPVAPRRATGRTRASTRRWPISRAQRALEVLGRRPARRLPNWDELTDMRNPLGERQGINERIMLRELLRRVDMMVMLENRLDVLVRLHTPLPPGKIGARRAGLPQQPHAGSLRAQRRPHRSADSGRLRHHRLRPGLSALSDDRKTLSCTSPRTSRPQIPPPGLPFSLVFRSEPGKEDITLRIASAYEAASRRRVPPPAFGPLPARQHAQNG